MDLKDLVMWFLLSLLFLYVQASTEKNENLKRKRELPDSDTLQLYQGGFPPDTKIESETFDIVDNLGKLITTTIKKITKPKHSSPDNLLHINDTAAAMIYHQTTEYAITLETSTSSPTMLYDDFMTGMKIDSRQYVYTVEVTSKYIRYFPFTSARYSFSRGKLVLHTIEPLYHQLNQITGEFSFTIHPMVCRLSVRVHQYCTVKQQRIVFHDSPTHQHLTIDHNKRILKQLDLFIACYSPEMIHLGNVSFIQTLLIESTFLQPVGFTEITLPAKVDVFKFRGRENFVRLAEYPKWTVTIYVTEITETIQLEYITIKTLNLRSMFFGSQPHSLVFNSVHFLHSTAVNWPIIPLESISLAGCTWPDTGLDLSSIPSVIKLELSSIIDIQIRSTASMTSFIFPQSVMILTISLRDLHHFNPTNFPAKVTEIRLFRSDIMSEYGYVNKLCQMLIKVINEDVDSVMKLQLCQDRMSNSINELSRSPYWSINIPELKAYLRNEEKPSLIEGKKKTI